MDDKVKDYLRYLSGGDFPAEGYEAVRCSPVGRSSSYRRATATTLPQVCFSKISPNTSTFNDCRTHLAILGIQGRELIRRRSSGCRGWGSTLQSGSLRLHNYGQITCTLISRSSEPISRGTSARHEYASCKMIFQTRCRLLLHGICTRASLLRAPDYTR